MVQCRFPDEMSASEPSTTGWSYWRPGVDDIVEVGTLRGNEVGLPTHFHRENQITFVLSGRRRFLIGGALITVLPGQGALIPSGVAHGSLPEPCGVACLNVYAPAGDYDMAAIVAREPAPMEQSGPRALQRVSDNSPRARWRCGRDLPAE
jgi:mannose-6-phosphate isomerase-like protein (cupin superfamily)